MEQNIEITRGDTASFNLQFVDFAGDLEHDVQDMFLTVKEDINGSVLFQKSLGNGISKVIDNVYVVRIAPEDTEDLNLGYYYYDFEVKINDDVFTLLKGVMQIAYDVTDPTSIITIAPYAELQDIRVGYNGDVYPSAGDAVRDQVNDLHEEVDVLDGRMDEFASLPEGSTAGDAELVDIRVGANGITYPSAGDAVRGQVEELDNKVLDNATDISEIDSDVDVLKARMDTFASLPDGSTAGDAELEDIRVGADGVTYASAGDAVRGQVSDLKTDFDNLSNVAELIKSENIFDKDTMADNGYWYRGSQSIGTVIYKDEATEAYSAIKIPIDNPSNVTIKQLLNVGTVNLVRWDAVDVDMKYLAGESSLSQSIASGFTITNIPSEARYLLLSLVYYPYAVDQNHYLSAVVGTTAKDYSPYFEPYYIVSTQNIEDGAIKTAKIADNAVDTQKVNDNAITPPKTSFMELKHGENQFDITTMLYENKWYTSFTVGSKAVMSNLDAQYHDNYIAFKIPLYKAEQFVMSVASNSNAYCWKYALIDENDIVLSKDDTNTLLKDGKFVSNVDASTVAIVGTLQYWKTELIDKNLSVMVAYGTTIKDFVPYVAPWWDAPNKKADEAYEEVKNKRSVLYISKEDDDTNLLLKMLEAYNKGNVDVFFEKAIYHLKDAYLYMWNTLNWRWSNALPCGNGCRYFFNDSTIISNPPDNPPTGSNAERNILDCRNKANNFEVHDVTLINNGGRYCIHDEGNNSVTPYCHKYENVVMIYNKTADTPDTGSKAFGCGTGFDAGLTFDGCVFKHNNGQNSGRLAIHGPTTNPDHDTSNLHLIMKNCYFDLGTIYVENSTFEDGSTLDFFLFDNKFTTAFDNPIVNIIDNNNTVTN